MSFKVPSTKKKKSQTVDDVSIMLDGPMEEEEEEEDWMTVDNVNLPIEFDPSQTDRADPSDIREGKVMSILKIDSKTAKQTFEQYPKTYEGACMRCLRPITGTPIFVPSSYDHKKQCWILHIFAYHHEICAKGKLLESSNSNKAEELGLLSRFLREYFNKDLVNIGYIPLSAIKELNPLGYLTWEEYDGACMKYVSTIRTPPFRFTDTFIQMLNMDEREDERRRQFEEMNNIKATEEQQENFVSEMKRVVKRRQSANFNIVNTPIGKSLGSIKK